MKLGIDPKVDYAFKRVFGDPRNADILTHLLNSVLKLPEPIVTVEILNPFNDKDFADDKLTVLDVKAQDQAGRLWNVEMQLLLPKHFCARILYYWAGLYRQQLAEGDSYGKLRPAISICLLNQKLFEDVEDYHLAFGLYDVAHGICLTEHVRIHLLELPKFNRELRELRDPLEKWIYFFRYAETMEADALPVPFRDPIYQRTVKELEMLTKDALERERYEARQKAIRDQMSLLEGALEQGLEQGLERGRTQGMLIERVRLCQQLLNRPVTPEDELLRLPIDELRALADKLKSELASR
ncbi:MAG: Rpn family recombination-promoting nuclease/putative transposase [Thermoguttaceae bacterium]|nr:Rpn family recombination-promoting nuclease/putative transposase [Thermoguttaceae bacterium]